MNDFDSNVQEKEDWRVELSDLDLPRSRSVSWPAWVKRYTQRWQVSHPGRRMRKLGNAGMVLVILLVIVLLSGSNVLSLVASQLRTDFGLFVSSAPQNSPSSTLIYATPFTRVHGVDGIACLLDAQWSPDGNAIAVLGYQYNCPGNHDVPGVLNIYNARTGKLTAQWQPDDTILTIINAPTVQNQGASARGILATSSFKAANPGSANAGSTRLLPFSYNHVMWSPDGRWLALSFVVYMQQQPFFGVLQMQTDGHFSRVIFQPPNLNEQMPLEWDITTGQALGFTPVPPAIGYHWGANGTLIPELPLSSGTLQPEPLKGPVGNPDGNSGFTIWQPGFTTFTTIAGYYGWSTSFSAWSPDGRYLIDNINLRGFYRPPATIIPDVQALIKLKLRHNRLLSPRNVAVFELDTGSPIISWRPDGLVLATYYYEHGYIVFYNSQTGRALQTLQLPPNRHLMAGALSLLRWSPDGSHLLLSSSLSGLLNIWGPGQLPTV